MRRFLRSAAGFTCLVALTCAGCSSGSDSNTDSTAGSGSDAASAPPSQQARASASPSESSASTTEFAPYVSATDASDNDTAGSPTTYNLAFVISDGTTCTPKWNGTTAIGDSAVRSRTAKLAAAGGSVRVSFGGASGKELAEVCDSASALAKAYGAALDAANSTQADFDVEGDTLTDSASVELRSKAIALLQKERTDLSVTFTLPVMPSGLDDDSVALLDSANNNSVQVSTVNIMTMNYSSEYAGDMGQYALASAAATHDQLADIFGLSEAGAWQGMALTSMIGVNDVDNETFSLADAAEVRAFAEEKGVAWVSMWATFRDQECEKGNASSDDAATNCSGVSQDAGAFGVAFSG
ncbi:chitinase [Streptomyces sp. AK08-02]|uniref:chitinase n=1 Tax=Streptomyces sp. AK08-02 TaxID=3028654 RepID=UPI0029B0FB60|nr:chitinase [Streptomyces sp. AK08-02]MDX3747817.1 chitinase [Streptomyces sp. AK08-02]